VNLRALSGGPRGPARGAPNFPSFRSPGHGAVLTEAQEEQAEACGRHQDGTTLLAFSRWRQSTKTDGELFPGLAMEKKDRKT